LHKRLHRFARRISSPSGVSGGRYALPDPRNSDTRRARARIAATHFQKKRGLGTITLKEYAREVGVVNKKFLETLVNSTYSWEVRADLLEGLEKGVRDVPAIFLNGEKFEGKPTYDALKKSIEDLLKPKKMKSENKKRA
jgi:predicted DsbA family dithiol-disulfide isomerase